MSDAGYQVDNVSVALGGAPVLNEVSLSIEPGNVTAILGPNGAGKSTLLSVLSGDIHPDAGHVRLLGRDLSSWSARDLARTRAVMPQQTMMQFAFRVEQVVAMGRSPLPPESAEDEERAIAHAMERTGVLELRSRSFRQLSGGERARTSFSRVLTQETPFVLLDEPTASLDVRHQHDVMRISRELAADGGTVITVLHDINLACTYADRLILMSHGKVVAQGTPAEVATTQLLSRVFEYPMVATTHPFHGGPMVLSRAESQPPARS